MTNDLATTGCLSWYPGVAGMSGPRGIQRYARRQRLRMRFLRAGHYVGIHKFRHHNLRPIGLEFHALKCDWCGYLKRRQTVAT